MGHTFHETMEYLADACVQLKREQPKVGKPRLRHDKDIPTTWREITIDGQTFRVLTIEDEAQ